MSSVHKIKKLEQIKLVNNKYRLNNQVYFDRLKEIIETHPHNYSKVLHSTKNQYLVDWIDSVLPKCIIDNGNTFATKCFWILNGFDDFPICGYCHKEKITRSVVNVFLGYFQRKIGTTIACSQKCAVRSDEVKEKTRLTCQRIYKTDSPGQNEEVKAKSRKTCKDKYDVEYSFQSENNKTKSKKTCLKRYKAISFVKSTKYSDLWKDPEFTKARQDKSDAKKLKNKSFNTSTYEEKAYQLLLEKFILTDIQRQYKDARYPYKCDFYIQSLDLFIECNFHWTHGQHLFDKNNENDIKKLLKWQEKSKISKFYKKAIEVWTNLDIKKHNIFIENNLKYKVFYNMNDFNKWITTL